MLVSAGRAQNGGQIRTWAPAGPGQTSEQSMTLEKARTREKTRTLEQAKTPKRVKTPDRGKAPAAHASLAPAPDCMIVD